MTKCLPFVALFLACVCAMTSSSAAADRPAYTEYAQMARWLVHANTWGVLASVSADNTPLSGVLSFSDGPTTRSTGRILFYMTPMDETTQNIMVNPQASFTITEAQLHPEGCHATDPEDPTCAKLSVLGQVQPVPAEAQSEAMAFMVARHPAMARWPTDHGFTLYELHVQELHLLDWYGGMHLISPQDYFAAAVTTGQGQAAAGPLGEPQRQQAGGRQKQAVAGAKGPGAILRGRVAAVAT